MTDGRLFIEDSDALTKPGVVRTMYDPTAGTGGILSVAEEHLQKFNDHATLKLFGQELEDETYAICKADMLIRGQNPANIANGDTLAMDMHPGETFEYQAANPPYGVEWKPAEGAVRKEHARGAKRHESLARAHNTDTDASGGIVATSSSHDHPRGKAKTGSEFGAKGAGGARAFDQLGHLSAGQVAGR